MRGQSLINIGRAVHAARANLNELLMQPGSTATQITEATNKLKATEAIAKVAMS